MAREIIQRIWCDPCMDAEQRREGEYVTIGIGNRKPREIAFCPAHRESLFDPLETIVNSLGQVAEGPASPPKGVSVHGNRLGRPPGGARPKDLESATLCVGEGCAFFATTLKALRNHCSSVHKINAADYDEQFGRPGSPRHKELEAAKRLAMEDIPDRFRCTVSGCDVAYSPSDYKRPEQAIGQHRRRAHPDVDFKALENAS